MPKPGEWLLGPGPHCRPQVQVPAPGAEAERLPEAVGLPQGQASPCGCLTQVQAWPLLQEAREAILKGSRAPGHINGQRVAGVWWGPRGVGASWVQGASRTFGGLSSAVVYVGRGVLSGFRKPG